MHKQSRSSAYAEREQHSPILFSHWLRLSHGAELRLVYGKYRRLSPIVPPYSGVLLRPLSVQHTLNFFRGTMFPLFFRFNYYDLKQCTLALSHCEQRITNRLESLTYSSCFFSLNVTIPYFFPMYIYYVGIWNFFHTKRSETVWFSVSDTVSQRCSTVCGRWRE